MPNEVNGEIKSPQGLNQLEIGNEMPEVEEMEEPGFREAFRVALQQARRQRKPTAGREELGRDKTKSLAVLVGGSILLLVLFFGLFSSSRKPNPLGGENHKGQPNLGHKTTPGQENNDAGKTLVPMMTANVRSADPVEEGQITAEDVGRTAHAGAPRPAPPSNFKDQEKYAIGAVDFSDPSGGTGETSPFPPPRFGPQVASSAHDAADLKKPSLAFVRSTEASPTAQVPSAEDDEQMTLPAGTRLIARLLAPVSSATATPAVAVVEYNYEHNGQIVVPAGAKVFGRLAQVNSSGYVDLEFNRVELPDGRVQKIDASAMDLEFGPLKGSVSGKKRGTRFLVRSLTGIGTMASYLVGPQGSTAAGVLSGNTLLRERLSDNIGTAGQEELNSLALTQNLVVTVPGNTLFYIVLQKPTSDPGRTTTGRRSPASTVTSGLTGSVPTLEELRQLLDLRREINELYTESNSPPANQPPHPEQ